MKRVGALGELSIDGQLVKKDEIGGRNRFLRTTTPVYFGGIDPEVIDSVKDNQVDVSMVYSVHVSSSPFSNSNSKIPNK